MPNLENDKQSFLLSTSNNEKSSGHLPHVDECEACDTCIVDDTPRDEFKWCGTVRAPGVLHLFNILVCSTRVLPFQVLQLQETHRIRHNGHIQLMNGTFR